MMRYVPVMRTVNNQGDGTLFGRADFRYQPESDSYICPGDKRLLRKHTNHKDRYTMYKASSTDCAACSLKSRCTQAPRRGLARHLYEDALNRMHEGVTPEAMRLRRCTVEHPTAQNRIDFRNHSLDRPADVLSEDLPEPFKQRCRLLQLGRIVGSPFPLKAQHTPIFKTQESEALSLFQIHHPTLVLVDLNAELRKLLAQPSVYRLHQPVTPPFSVDQDHHIVRKTCILDVS